MWHEYYNAASIQEALELLARYAEKARQAVDQERAGLDALAEQILLSSLP